MVKSYPILLIYLQPSISASFPIYDSQILFVHQSVDGVMNWTSTPFSSSTTMYARNTQQIWYLNLKLYSLANHVVLPLL